MVGTSPHLLQHEGGAMVFEDYADMLARIDDPDLDVTATSVLVLMNCSPKAVQGMPEWGTIPIPRKLQAVGVNNMVRISNARMSGLSEQV
jgi:dihydroxyacid dehydratase/phosphogluconate dehydratase